MGTTETAAVVVGVSGTATSLAAVRSAATEAALRAAPLRLIHAFDWALIDAGVVSVGTGNAGIARIDVADAHAAARRAAGEIMERAVAVAEGARPPVAVTAQVVDGAPGRVLLRQSHTAALLVVGDDEPDATVCQPIDSVLLQLAARAWCPVLVARPGGASHGPVLVGVDGSAPSLLALAYAAGEAARRGVPLDVLHVWEPAAGEDASNADSVLTAACARLDDSVTVRPRAVAGDPAARLIAAAERAGLLAVGPRGAGRGPATLLGAVGQTVLRHCPCPAVFVHGTPVAMANPPGASLRHTPGRVT